jgi:ketosteroid isomerase-like protein
VPQTEAPASAVDGAFAEDFYPRWVDAWNSHHAERVLALMTEDIAYRR